jgi:hypothetical protein
MLTDVLASFFKKKRFRSFLQKKNQKTFIHKKAGGGFPPRRLA